VQALNFYKCLSDHNRLKILLLLCRDQELCVCELMDNLGESQPKVSRHLAQLRCCNLIQQRREGQWMYYRLHEKLPDWCLESLELALVNNRNFLHQGKTTFEDMRA
jgi:ArsR family transcriptional regulator